MKYLTGYVWQAPQEGLPRQRLPRESSILLRQISYGKCNVVLGCVCSGGIAGGYLTGGLRVWLSDRGKELFAKNADDNVIGRELQSKLKGLYDEVQGHYGRQNAGGVMKLELAGILIADQKCWLMQAGESSLFLLNRRFQRTHCKRIGVQVNGTHPIQIAEGRIQKCVGVLLGNSDFLQNVSKEAISQCLAAQDIVREAQAERRLQELAQESYRQGYAQECSAVYVRSI